MKIVRGKFFSNGKPAANAQLILELGRTAHKLIESGQELDWPSDYDEKVIQLDEHGQIPPKTRIICNDEVLPEDTDYEIRLIAPDSDGEGRTTTLYSNWLNIIGPEPIDIPSLDPQLLPDPPAPPPPPPPPFGVRRSTKVSGFFGGIVRPPTNDVRVTPILNSIFNNDPRTVDQGFFKVYAFALSRRSTIDRVSIVIHTPSPIAGQEVIVALYDLQSRKKLCDVALDATKSGMVEGVFADPVTLSAGDYIYAWATSRPCNALRVYGWDDSAGFNPVVLRLIDRDQNYVLTHGIARGRVGTRLPETLGLVEEETPPGEITSLFSNTPVQTKLPELPILVYFDQAEIPASRRISQ
jgi:hypothetical protein